MSKDNELICEVKVFIPKGHHNLANEIASTLQEAPMIHRVVVDGISKTVVVFGDCTYNYDIAKFLSSTTEEERNNLFLLSKIKQKKQELENLEKQLTNTQ